MSVRNLLHDVLGYEDNFIEQTVRTIFRNNRPVDDIDNVFIKDGDRLALGGAMPGIVGIVMGRDNPYKSFRSDISVQKEVKARNIEPITISMKIFSTLAVETGIDVLGRGILVESLTLADFLEEKSDLIIEADGKKGKELVEYIRTMKDKIGIRVIFE
ncbi:hypothetical protein SYK_08680 [Pseudodesulfovibrio nedwellii]|uniref:Uncharacterized protein n=2 Tax=Pseudodesulfovibrio nedwellii TaxID=2973072 RepID=A0ABM8AYV8_9BACT|nr:hypothetical protein SYK_08680 [Pseudodesulfovibrio nedwellii]